jgi:hypothetical protein
MTWRHAVASRKHTHRARPQRGPSLRRSSSTSSTWEPVGLGMIRLQRWESGPCSAAFSSRIPDTFVEIVKIWPRSPPVPGDDRGLALLGQMAGSGQGGRRYGGRRRPPRHRTLKTNKAPWRRSPVRCSPRRRSLVRSPRGHGALQMEWWRRGGSNSRPSHCERDALPAELRPHLWFPWSCLKSTSRKQGPECTTVPRGPAIPRRPPPPLRKSRDAPRAGIPGTPERRTTAPEKRRRPPPLAANRHTRKL